ncbi:hypothetical protein [Methylomicrobium sp. Wu6]|uniref:hypothetical protein n=1 Tax=Methylomicrobium sp. Wu6 TaxID=3107928 RepID=UPI002DD68F13|nr:hypothetical protein [Methylomicrobium sp. Wu6]MEC4750057.1 hypothetical protein [Methylomicrobium sp. Wu6]
MNVGLTFYNEEGKIICTYSGQNPQGQKSALSEYSWIEGEFHGDEMYVEFETPILRPTQATIIDKTTITADCLDAATLTGVPDGAVFSASNVDTGESVSGPISGSDTFSTSIAGTYALRISCWPYLDWQETVNAV